jgi:hypothetical protein
MRKTQQKIKFFAYDLGYSHSIINELSKLLIRKALSAASQFITVTFTVNLPGTSIGAGVRAARPKLPFEIYRDLSVLEHSPGHFRRASWPSDEPRSR